MSAHLNAYPEYRDSGTGWLGGIPSHWKTLRAKYLLKERDLRSASGSEQLLRVSQYTGVTERKSTDGSDEPDTRAASLVGYKRVMKDDLVINIMLAWNGSLGVSEFDGICSPAYCVYSFRNDVLPHYYHHLLRSPEYKCRIKASSTGVVESRLRLYTDDLNRIELLLPPPEEQTAIVKYLDHADRRIRQYIAAKRRLIALLSEQKQALIHRAVTRGLDPAAPLRPSGISWLGDIPAHWEVKRSKYLFREVDERSETGAETHLSMSQKHGLIPNSEMDAKRMISESYAGGKLCDMGDLVLNRLKAHLGVFALSPQHGVISPDYTVLRPISEMDARYFEAVYRTPACRVELRKRAKGIVQGFWRLYTDDFYDIRMPIPPVEEQRQIMLRLDAELAELNHAIARVEREIDLLREYRTRLIADVVTGKLDVRAAAALPDLPADAPGDTDTPDPESDSADPYEAESEIEPAPEEA